MYSSSFCSRDMSSPNIPFASTFGFLSAWAALGLATTELIIRLGFAADIAQALSTLS